MSGGLQWSASPVDAGRSATDAAQVGVDLVPPELLFLADHMPFGRLWRVFSVFRVEYWSGGVLE